MVEIATLTETQRRNMIERCQKNAEEKETSEGGGRNEENE